MRLEQQAGHVALVARTDGSPIAIDISLIDMFNGTDTTARLSVDDLHDLQYCVGRMLTKIAARTALQDRRGEGG